MSRGTRITVVQGRLWPRPAVVSLGLRRSLGASKTPEPRASPSSRPQRAVAVASRTSKQAQPPRRLPSLDNSLLLKLWHSLAHPLPSDATCDPGDGRRAQFLYHVNAPRCGMGARLCLALDDVDSMPGRLYIFRRRFSPGYVKIGWTAHDVDARMRAWSRKCGYDPVLVHSTGIIPNARRVETLVHEQLAWERRLERRCDGCGGAHVEWFEMDSDRAIEVVDSWAALMVRAGEQPRERNREEGGSLYTQDGQIRDVWARAVFALAGKPGGRWAGTITARILQESYDRVLAEEAGPEIRKATETIEDEAKVNSDTGKANTAGTIGEDLAVERIQSPRGTLKDLEPTVADRGPSISNTTNKKKKKKTRNIEEGDIYVGATVERESPETSERTSSLQTSLVVTPIKVEGTEEQAAPLMAPKDDSQAEEGAVVDRRETRKERRKRMLAEQMEMNEQRKAEKERKKEETKRRLEKEMEIIQQRKAEKEQKKEEKKRRLEEELKLIQQRKAEKKEENRKQAEARMIENQEKRAIKLEQERLLTEARKKQNQEEKLEQEKLEKEKLEKDEKMRQESSQKSDEGTVRLPTIFSRIEQLLSTPWRIKK